MFFYLCELFKEECIILGTVVFLQDLELDLRMYLSVSWNSLDIELPRGQYFWGFPEYHFSPRPRAAVTFHTSAAGDEGLLLQTRVIFLPIPLSGTG